MILRTPEEFRFDECLRFLNRSKQERLHRVDGGRLRKLVRFGDQNIVLELTEAAKNSIEVIFLNGAPGKPARARIREYVRNWFDLERDLAPFYQMATTDRLLAPLVRDHYGLRIIQIADLFQALCWTIIGQQINLAFAYTLYERFVESFGEKFEFEEETYWLFPSPERISAILPEDLTRLQFTGRKAEYIIGLAQLIENGKLSRATLTGLGDYEAALNALLNIRGVGRWTANYVLMRCLGFARAFPIEDVGLHRAIQNQLGLNRKPTVDEIQVLASGWTDWEAYATFYLYRSLL